MKQSIKMKYKLSGSWDAAHELSPMIRREFCVSEDQEPDEAFKQYQIGYDYTIFSLYGVKPRS